MKRILLVLSVTMLTVLGTAAESAPLSDGAKRWWQHVEYLASDELGGRDTGSPGHRTAAEYVAGRFAEVGLRPAGTGGFLQPVELMSLWIDEGASSVTLVGSDGETPLELGKHGIFSVSNGLADKVSAEMVFVGYGLRIPEAGHDDLQGVDLKGKIAVYLTGGPAGIPGPLLAHMSSGRERWRALQAAGAVGTVSIPNPKRSDIPWQRIANNRLRPSMTFVDPELRSMPGVQFAFTVNPEHADLWLDGTGHSMAAILEKAGSGGALPRFPLKNRLEARATVNSKRVTSENVVAMLPGSDPELAKEYVLLSAHLDHVGKNLQIEGDAINNGAMDNASGIASLIEVARLLKQRNPKRSVLFAAVTGEEKGLLGARVFAEQPTVPVKQIVANVNMDMFLPLHKLTILEGIGNEESTLGEELRMAAREFGLQVVNEIEPQRNLFVRSDQYAFILRGIPSIYFKFGYEKGSPEEAVQQRWLKERYHGVKDDAEQPVAKEDAYVFTQVLAELTTRVANAEERPRWSEGSFFKRFAE